MCGLFGFVGLPQADTPNILRRLAIKNMERGRDSTGLARIQGEKVQIAKDVGPASLFVNTNSFLKLFSGMDPTKHTIFMGHTRAATMGAVSKRNAHPFRYKHIVASHNGMITNLEELKSKFLTHGDAIEVDSEIFPRILSVESALKGATEVTGSFVVPYVNMKIPTNLQVLVKTNPFNFFRVEHGLYYSSESEALRWALRKDHIEVQFLPTDSVFTFFKEKEEVQYHGITFVPKIPVYNYPPPIHNPRATQNSLFGPKSDGDGFAAFESFLNIVQLLYDPVGKESHHAQETSLAN